MATCNRLCVRFRVGSKQEASRRCRRCALQNGRRYVVHCGHIWAALYLFELRAGEEGLPVKDLRPTVNAGEAGRACPARVIAAARGGLGAPKGGVLREFNRSRVGEA